MNRFVVLARTGGGTVTAHLPTTGRLGEILVPDTPLILHPKRGPSRRHPYDVWAGWQGGEWVGLDARRAAPAVAKAWADLEAVPRLPLVAEVTVGGSRLDFRLGDDEGWVEVKAVTLVEGKTALFPDAPTERGRRHVELLGERARKGDLAYLVFAAMRSRFERADVHETHDPAFARAVATAREAGVEIRVLAFTVTPTRLVFAGERPFGG